MPRTGQRLWAGTGKQAVDFFVASTLPRRMGIGEPDIHIQPVHQLGIARHFGAPVVGHAGGHGSRELLQLAAKTFERSIGCAAVHLAEDHKACLSLDQCPHARTVECPLDQVALPMSWDQSLLYFLGAMSNAQLLRHLGPFGSARATPATRGLALPQCLYQLLLQPAAGMCVDACVDCLVADAMGRVIGVHGTHAWQQSAGATSDTAPGRHECSGTTRFPRRSYACEHSSCGAADIVELLV